MKTSIYATLIALATVGSAAAQQRTEHRLGDHPAVVVQRLYQQQGYDYASKFYPHPAWLYLVPAPDATAEKLAARPKSKASADAAESRLAKAPR